MRGLPLSYNLHDVSFWIDGLGQSDKKNGTAYTFANTSSGALAHDGRWIIMDETGSITVGANNESIKSIIMWLKPVTGVDTLVDLDGVNTITRSGGDVISNITDAVIYVNGVAAIGTSEDVSNFIAVTWPTGITASNVVLCSGLNGSVTSIIGFQKELTASEIREIYNKFGDASEATPTDVSDLLLETGDYLLLETEYNLLLE